jgi:hypothetical protein
MPGSGYHQAQKAPIAKDRSDMLSFISSLFTTTQRRSGAVDNALLERAIDRAVAGSDPRLRALPGYRKRLRGPVENAVTHVIGLVNRLPAPSEISRPAYRSDPCLRAFFVSPEHLQQTIGHCATVIDYLRASKPAPDAFIFGLLSMECKERNILGMDLHGDTFQREVAQVAVNFCNHRFLGPSGDDAETRRELMRRGFDYLVEQALAHIVAARTQKADLAEQRLLLQRKLEAMQSGNWGLDAVFADGDASHPDLAALAGQIEAVESQLLSLGGNPHSLEHSLEHLAATLGDPGHWLDLRSTRLEVNQLSIKSGPGTAGPVYKLELTELFVAASGERRIVLLGRFPVEDLPPQPDFLAEATRFLG